jgi:ATP-dependent DNA helicase RecG
MTNKKDLVISTLEVIETLLNSGEYRPIESEFIELKDLSTRGDWTSLKETICAFLNTNGGYVICGIRERENSYRLSGFDRNNEDGIIELQSKVFKNDNDLLIDLTENIDFSYFELSGKALAVISVLPLSEDLKFVKYNGKYFYRVLTEDREIQISRLNHHKEYKSELEYSKEINPVSNASIDDLDNDKINQFILKINATGKKETVKKDLADASDFLRRKSCITKDKGVTVLGLLLFGKEPSQYLENRARLDCYFETGHELGRDKKHLDDDILNLMDDAFSFVWGHIKVGRSVVGGGRSEPEFPVELIRETVNNALAHRDYTINKFITIKVNPGQSIEIKNPGTFKQKMVLTASIGTGEIRRIIPCVAEPKNPKLANILKSFDKIESQGIGMATLVGKCLENLIDVPYYDISIPDEISLVIPSGQLIDDETQRWLNSFALYIRKKLGKEPTREHELVLAYVLKSERLNQRKHYTILLSPSNNHFDVLSDLKQANLIFEQKIDGAEHSSVFLIDPELKLSDFTTQIEEITGQSISHFGEVYIMVLNIIFKYNYYGDESVKPNLITPELYLKLYGKEIDPIRYESLGRKVRKICADLSNDGILAKKPDKTYEINANRLNPLSRLPKLF